MNTTIGRRAARMVVATAMAASAVAPAAAAELIINGGFESGFAGWSRADALGSDGGFRLQTGTSSPISASPVPAPPQGAQAAMSDALGPGAHVLYQDFIVPSAPGAGSLSFALFIGNRAETGFSVPTPPTLDFALAALNQQARVDLLRAGSDPFSVATTDVLLNVFQTLPGDPSVSGYTTYTRDVGALLTGLAGETLRLRFAQTDNAFTFQLGVDAVSLATDVAVGKVPAPAPALLLAIGAGALLAGRRRSRPHLRTRASLAFGAVALVTAAASALPGVAGAQPSVVDPNLRVDPFVTGLSQPTGIAFTGALDAFVIEKATGRVRRVAGGVLSPTPALDLAVNSASERGLLGIALHPGFPTTPFVYLFWTESSTGADSTVVGEVPLNGNRVDRFAWNAGTQTLTFDRNLLRLRARQTDRNNAANPSLVTEQGNHDGGQLRFGPDGKLYVQFGDVGRRGWMQNLPNGPFLPPAGDDAFGGPQPDNAHLSGVILRINDDGSTPPDNPFFAVGAATGGEVGANLQLVYSYGHRNGFGMAFDPSTGLLWASENGDDSFDEINRIVPGGNYGWVGTMGPIARIAQFRQIEINLFNPATAALGAIQQLRYPPTRIAYAPSLALSRMLMLPGATYQDPQFSWRYGMPPAGLGFVAGTGLGAEYSGTLWSGAARPTDITGGSTGTFAGGYLMLFRLTPDRLNLDLSADPRLADRVADNGSYPPPFGTPANTPGYKFDGRESESLLFGRDFGVATDIQTGPDGNLYVVSSTNGAVYRISRVR